MPVWETQSMGKIINENLTLTRECFKLSQISIAEIAKGTCLIAKVQFVLSVDALTTDFALYSRKFSARHQELLPSVSVKKHQWRTKYGDIVVKIKEVKASPAKLKISIGFTNLHGSSSISS
jgi:hypothetical protein